MMKNKAFILLFIWLALNCSGSELESLADVFHPGKGIMDRDQDGFADHVSLCMIIPDEPTAAEIAAASDIAARANFDSLVVDFTLVKKEFELAKLAPDAFPVLIGSNLSAVKKWASVEGIPLDNLGKNQGFVALYTADGKNGLVMVGGSDEALLHTARAFFLRWPYLWEVWGREEGDTYLTLEDDLDGFFDAENLPPQKISIRKALYDFQTTNSPDEAIKKLQFNHGEIKDLFVTVVFDSNADQAKAGQAIDKLAKSHKRGKYTETLSYPGCAQITFDLRTKEGVVRKLLPRVGYPKRMLTPSYKPRSRSARTGKEFDLTGLFTSSGFYADSDGDQILDTLDSIVILPQKNPSPGTQWITSRLVLETAGASFPIAHFDEEIEDRESFKASILIGKDNRFNKELIETGKIHTPELKKGWGNVQVVPQGINKSSSLVILEEDALGLEKTLSFLGRTFPYFGDFGEGKPKVQDIPVAIEEFLQGKRGAAEAHFWNELNTFITAMEEKKFSHFNLRFFLPEENEKFVRHIREFLEKTLDSQKIDVQDHVMGNSKNIFLKEKEFSWEGDDAFQSIQQNVKTLTPSDSLLRISAGVSESPEVRKRIAEKIEGYLKEAGFSRYDIEVLSSYKQGLFWIKEKALPSLAEKDVHRVLIRFAPEQEDFTIPKRFYSEPCRWLQELYPIDEIIAAKTGLPLERIEFEMKEETGPIYEITAFGDRGEVLFEDHFSPRTREAVYMQALPEWGNVELTTGWVRITYDDRVIIDADLRSDLEKFWEYYQSEILQEVYSYILKNTGDKPAFTKQPYFKKLLIEMWLSEPDFTLGLDEEIVSSLEAIHDEIYFDTLDFLRGITEIELEEEDEIPEDTSRYSAPGNILPKIYPSSEGQNGKVKVTFDGWQARSPEMHLEWQEEGRRERTEKFTFPSLKAKDLRLPSFIYNGTEERIEELTADLEIEKEKDYLRILAIADAHKNLQNLDIVAQPFYFPNLAYLAVQVHHKNWEKEVVFPITPEDAKEKGNSKIPGAPDIPVPTREIISPQMCLSLAERLGHSDNVRSYIGGISYEKRKIPVLEIFTPLEKYVSIPRLITFKPTLYLSGRQHANEVSATNYILKFAELLTKDPDHREFVKKTNFILHPMENPDGADLAYDLQKLTPFHSLHAGRYTSLGIDVGYQVGVSKPLLPEAKVRKDLYDKWLPDIYLNLHGYPSHEWVQPFSNYIPYLFRDYWIPRGWFAYYRSLSLPLYEKWVKASDELKGFITREINANEEFRESNKKFYDRYFRWAARWQPHSNYLEDHDGVNLYAKRRSSRESRLSNRSRITFVEETPELMDETAQGGWLDFLVTQGLTYLKAHAKYLSQTKFETVRIEEESQDRIHIQIVRSRPGKLPENR